MGCQYIFGATSLCVEKTKELFAEITLATLQLGADAQCKWTLGSKYLEVSDFICVGKFGRIYHDVNVNRPF